MRQRIVLLLVGLMACALLALGVPLAQALSGNAHQEAYLDRLGDAARFASVAGKITEVDEIRALEREFERYEEVYGISVSLLDRRGEGIAIAGAPLRLDADARRSITTALAGRRPEPPSPVPPWRSALLVVAEPVVQEGDVTGVVVTASPTVELRREILGAWALLGVAMVLALTVCIGLASRLAGWVLRPVHRLDGATHAVAVGRLETRVPETEGPPELRRLARAFNQMGDNVEALIEQQRAFVADASHQLRNPLNALLLRLEELSLALPADDGAPSMDAVRAEAVRLTQLLDELLQLAQAEQAPGVCVPVDTAVLVRERAAAWRVVADRRAITISCDTTPDAVALADGVRLGSAVDALIDNAVKFGDDGGSVHLSAKRCEDSVLVRVWDDGPGLPASDLVRAGDRFWRSSRHQNVPGSGLGLSITRRLVEGCGGHLRFEHASPRGLEAAITLPPADATMGDVSASGPIRPGLRSGLRRPVTKRTVVQRHG